MDKAAIWGRVLGVDAKALANVFPKKWVTAGTALAPRQRGVNVLRGRVRTVAVLVSYLHVNRA